jgi:hypothetical protein
MNCKVILVQGEVWIGSIVVFCSVAVDGMIPRGVDIARANVSALLEAIIALEGWSDGAVLNVAYRDIGFNVVFPRYRLHQAG